MRERILGAQLLRPTKTSKATEEPVVRCGKISSALGPDLLGLKAGDQMGLGDGCGQES